MSDSKIDRKLTKLLIHSNNQYLPLLVKYMKQKGLTPETLANLMGLEKVTLFSKDGGFPTDPTEQEPFTKIMIGRLLLVLGVDPKNFLLSEADEQKWIANFDPPKKKDGSLKADKYFTRSFWQEIQKYRSQVPSLVKVHYIKKPNRVKDEELTSIYQEIALYFSEARVGVEVHEVLSKGDNRKSNEYTAHLIAQKYILTAIVIALVNNSKSEDPERRLFRYDRIFYLSRSERIFPKRTRQECLIAFVAEASIQSLLHVKECLTNYRHHCNFRVATVKSYRHQAIIDNRYVLTEDYKVTKNDGVLAERLSIMDVVQSGEVGQDYINMIRGHAEDHEDIFWITEDAIEMHLLQAIDYLKDKKTRLQTVRDKIEDNTEEELIELYERYKERVVLIEHQIERLDEKIKRFIDN